MLFIMSNVFILFLVLGLIFYRVLHEVLLPAFWKSKYAQRFKKRISRAVAALFFEIRADVIAHLTTLCEPDGDEPFEPYLDSPLRTCPPCEYVQSPPKEVRSLQINNGTTNGNLNPPPIIVAAANGRRIGRVQQRGAAAPAAGAARARARPVVRLPLPQGIVAGREWAGLEIPPQSPPPVPVMPVMPFIIQNPEERLHENEVNLREQQQRLNAQLRVLEAHNRFLEMARRRRNN